MAYKPSPRGGMFMGVKGTTDFGLLDDITQLSTSPDAGQQPTTDATMSLYSRRRAGRATAGTPGTVSFDMEPAIGLPAWQDLYNIQGTLAERSFRFENGLIEETIDSGTARIAIETTGDATLSLPTTAVTNFAGATEWEEGTLLVVGTDAYVFESFTSELVATVKPVGAVASNVVTIDHDADIDADVSATAFKVYEFAARRNFRATVETIADTLSAESSLVTVTLRPDDFVAVSAYLLADSARQRAILTG